MNRQAFLLEIGTEEIPARFLEDAAKQLGERIGRLLRQFDLGGGEPEIWWTPRRLAVRVPDVAEAQQDRVEKVLGPPVSVGRDAEGAWTRAAEGFAAKTGVDLEELQTYETPRGEYLGFERKVAGKSLEEVLDDSLESVVGAMTFPKTMRWGEGRYRWVRPVHWVVALHGPRELSVQLFGIRAGRRTRGHRFLQPEGTDVSGADGYLASLREVSVLADPSERQERIETSLREQAAGMEGEVVADPDLLREVRDLVEWPGVVAGRFDPAFLELPGEILATTLRHHQKCFAVRRGGDLLPAFLAVANTDRDPEGHIRRGNEWVVSGRLADARFFWNEDRRRPLESRLEELQGVVFHERLGTYRQKADRLRALSSEIAAALPADAGLAARCARAGLLAKCDLVTGLVGEFPELEGVAGGLLLEAEGEDRRVSRAVYEHYRPRGAEDAIPESLEGSVVSLADKLDTLTGCFGVGLEPTGSRDPLALRRAALGVERILLGSGLDDLDLEKLLELSESLWAGHPRFQGARERLRTFLDERLQHLLVLEGLPSDVVEAVLAVGAGRRPADARSRTLALAAARGSEHLRHLAVLHKRTRRILRQAEERKAPVGPVQSELLREPAEQELYELSRQVRAEVERLAAAGRYGDALEIVATLAAPLDRFFEDVLVMSGGATQACRLGLLEELSRLLSAVADFSRIQTEEKVEAGS